MLIKEILVGKSDVIDFKHLYRMLEEGIIYNAGSTMQCNEDFACDFCALKHICDDLYYIDYIDYTNFKEQVQDLKESHPELFI